MNSIILRSPRLFHAASSLFSIYEVLALCRMSDQGATAKREA